MGSELITLVRNDSVRVNRSEALTCLVDFFESYIKDIISDLNESRTERYSRFH